MKKKWIGRGLLVLLVVAQLIPLDRFNPAAAGEFTLPDDVRQIVRTSCYDCHSNETKWPYGYVAPVSWMLAYHVHEGREHLNFSSWGGGLTPEKQKKMAHEMWEEVEEGEMPMGVYLLMHSEGKLSEANMQALKTWSEHYGVVPEASP